MVLFDWTNENNEDLLLSFSKDEILLNEKASKYFFNYKWAMILIDDHNQRFAISPISKNQKDLNLFSNRQKYKLFLSKNKIKIKNTKTQKESPVRCTGLSFIFPFVFQVRKNEPPATDE